jgi:hypothetical protein
MAKKQIIPQKYQIWVEVRRRYLSWLLISSAGLYQI